MVRPRIVESPVRSPLEELLEEWLQDVEATGAGRKTLQLYRSAMERFLAYSREQGITTPDRLTRPLLTGYINALVENVGEHGKRLSAASVHAYTRPVNTFLRWAGQDPKSAEGQVGGGVEAIRGLRAPLRKPPRRKIPVLSREEIRDIEDAASNDRDKLIIRLLGDTAIRLGELLTLTPDRLIPTGGPRGRRFINVLGKGDKEREVPLSPALYERLRRYIAKTRPKDTSSDRVFLGLRRDARTKEFAPLTESGAEQMVRLTAQAAGIDRRVYPHLFRHSSITHMVKRGMNPVIIADIAGHASLKMIQEVYAQITPDDRFDAMMEALKEGD